MAKPVKHFVELKDEKMKDGLAEATRQARIGRGVPYKDSVQFAAGLVAVVVNGSAAVYDRNSAHQIFGEGTPEFYALREGRVPSTSSVYACDII